MPASIIPVTGLILGPVGSFSQTDFPVVSPRLINATDTAGPNFGDAVVLNLNNTYSSVATFISQDSSSVTATTPIGFAVANVKTNTFYPTNGTEGTIANTGNYPPTSEADVLTRGTINIAVPAGTPAGAGSPVFIRTALNLGVAPNSVVGSIEGSTLTGNVQLTSGIVFKTGILSTDPATGQITAQVTILNRLIP